MRSQRISGSSPRTSSPVKQYSSEKRSVSPQKTEGKSLLKRAVAGAIVGAATGIGLAAAPAGAIAWAATLVTKFLAVNILCFLGSIVVNAKVPAAISEDEKSYESAKKACAYTTIAAGLLFLTPALAFAGCVAYARCK